VNNDGNDKTGGNDVRVITSKRLFQLPQTSSRAGCMDGGGQSVGQGEREGSGLKGGRGGLKWEGERG